MAKKSGGGCGLVTFVVVIVVISLAFAYPSAAAGVGVAAIVAALVIRSRRETVPASASAGKIVVTIEGVGPRGSASRGSAAWLTPASKVHPISDPNWPKLPPRPNRTAEPYVDPADRPYSRTTCPNCSVALDPLPKAKKRCPSCGEAIFVRSGPDGLRHLLSAAEIDALATRWAEFYAVRAVEIAAEEDELAAEWRVSLQGAGLLVGNDELEVVGESHYHGALAGIMAAARERPDPWEIHTVAELRREPGNQYDKNAVQVIIEGQIVGYLSREDAAEVTPQLARLRLRAFVHAVVAGGRLQDDGRVGPIGVTLVDSAALPALSVGTAVAFATHQSLLKARASPTSGRFTRLLHRGTPRQ